MKICPTCRRTYTDDGLNFCLEDGSVLTLSDPNPSQEQTLIMNQPRPTGTQVSPAAPTQPAVQQDWKTQAPSAHTMQPKKSSKTWLWVVGIFVVLILLCGGGFGGFLLLMYSQGDSAENTANTTANKATDTRKSSPSPSNKTSASPNPSPFDSSTGVPIDLTKWVQPSSVWGNTEVVGDELVMSSKQKGYYFVMVATEEHKTDGAITRVTLRNKDNADTTLGYGLVFHSDVTPLNRGYAFLIDSKKQKYRVVRHNTSIETAIQAWTSSPLIKSGSEENVLEARDKGESVELYINGTMVTSIKNTLTPKGGVPGIYSGDGIKIGFKQLEIAKQ